MQTYLRVKVIELRGLLPSQWGAPAVHAESLKTHSVGFSGACKDGLLESKSLASTERG